MILTSRYGKTRGAAAKICAAFFYTLLVTGLFLAENMGLALARYGTQGWDTGIQFNYLGWFGDVSYQINFGQACVYAVVIWITASLMLTGISLLVSAFCHSDFVALAAAALLYTVPMSFHLGETPAV